MKRYLMVLLCTLPFCTSAQTIEKQVVGAAGNAVNVAGGTVEFTIGEPVIGYTFSAQGTMSQGFHSGGMFPASVKDIPNRYGASLYPVPAYKVLYLEFAKPTPAASIYIYDMQGKQLQYTTIHSSGKQVIDISSLPPGSYMLNMVSKSTTIFTSAFIKQ